VHRKISIAQETYSLADNAAGGSYDWAKGVANAKYSYTIELRPAPNEIANGFLLPPSAIKPTGEEIWAGVKKMVKVMKRMR
jgi:hypothetical protein